MTLPGWMKGLIVALAVTVLVYVLIVLPKPQKVSHWPVAPKNPTKIEVVGEPLKVTLEKSDTQWKLTSPVTDSADEETVRSLLASVGEMQVGDVITRRPEAHATYDIDDAQAVRLKIWEAKAQEPVEWWFGKRGPNFSDVFVRLPSQPEVYLTTFNREILERPVGRWRDRRVLVLEKEEEVTQVEVVKGRARFVLARSSDSWTVDGEPADTARVQQFTMALRLLSADDLTAAPTDADLKKYRLDKPEVVLRLTLTSGKKLDFTLSPRDEEAYTHYLKSSARAELFRIAPRHFQDLTPDKKSFLKLPSPTTPIR